MGRCYENCSCHCKRDPCKEIIRRFAPATYKLLRRVLDDGTVLTGPNVQGTLIYSKKGKRSVTVLIEYPNGLYFNISLQATYSINSTYYTDKQDAFSMQIPAPQDAPCTNCGQATIYSFEPVTGTAPVTCVNDTIVINNPPLDPVTQLVFTKNALTAYIRPENGGGVDYWVRTD